VLEPELAQRLMQEASMEAKVDAELVRALTAVLAVDKDCDFQRLADVLGLGSHEVVRDSFADTAAYGVRKDIVGILVDTAACDHKVQTELSEDLVGNPGKRHVVANEIQQLAFPDDAGR
jgi:hypothetical protein